MKPAARNTRLAAQGKRLKNLHALAQMKADAELARLAATGQSRARLTAALAALGNAEQPLGPMPPPEDATSEAATKRREGTQHGGESENPVSGPDPQAIDPLLVRARLSHAKWIEAQQRELNARLAMVMADWHRLQPQAARAFGRARMLAQLAEAARAASKIGEKP